MPPNLSSQGVYKQNTQVASLLQKQKQTALGSLLTLDDQRPILIFLAGCNGAGKSSLFELIAPLFSSPPIFLNADLMTRLLQGIPAADQVSQKVTDILREHMLAQSTTFVTETVFSDEVGAKLGYLRRAAEAGFRVIVLYVSLPSWAYSKQRVKYRVEVDQGHNVESAKLQRRYVASHENARRALAFVEHGLVYDNSDPTDPFRLVAITHGGDLIQSFPPIAAHMTALLPPPAEHRTAAGQAAKPGSQN